MPVYIRAFCQGTNRFSPIKKLTAPIAPVQIPVADGFRQMMRQNLLGGFQIGYRTRNLNNTFKNISNNFIFIIFVLNI